MFAIFEIDHLGREARFSSWWRESLDSAFNKAERELIDYTIRDISGELVHPIVFQTREVTNV